MFIGGSHPAAGKEHVLPLTVRWESALPVRAAELRAGQSGLPIIDESSYAVAVYGIPSSSVDGSLKFLSEALQKKAALKTTGKKEIKPSRVDIVQQAGSTILIYVFPRSGEVADSDVFKFSAEIGQYFIAQPFAISEMQWQGKPQL